MARPTFLIAEPRPEEGISARKLVLETALFNVITAYDGHEALELLEAFPNVDAVVCHSGLGEEEWEPLIERAVAKNPARTVILISPGGSTQHRAAHLHLSSHDPKQLLEVVFERFGVPN